MTHLPTLVSRPQRWDTPFGADMSDADVDRVLASGPFAKIAPSSFPASLPLRGVIRNDTRLVRYHRGDLIVREGDYGHSAFVVLSGRARILVDKLDPALLGRRKPQHKSFLAAVAQLWTNHRLPEVRDLTRPVPPGHAAAPGAVFIQDVPGVVSESWAPTFEAGEIFGELAALGRTPRTATIVADDDCELVEIRWQGLRELRQRTSELKAYIDRLYRDRSLKVHLKETWLFAHLTDDELLEVADATEFETYGNFDWYGSYAALLKRLPEDRLVDEPVIADEGDYPNGVILVRAGFARVSQRHGASARTVSCLGRGQMFGMEELVDNWRSSGRTGHLPLQYTLRAIGYVDVLRVPTRLLERYVFPRLTARDLVERVPSLVDPALRMTAPVDEGTIEFLVDGRYINGTATMMIDLNRCVRCDECVKACASTHDNNPRFVRQGPVHDGQMVTNACMHCQDPVCMIGCPTGAIHRETSTGVVMINDGTCIGCGTCAASCPYDNIRMIEARDERGQWMLDSQSMLPILKATKCDLCVDQQGGPACVRACPYDALERVNLADPAANARWRAR